MAAAKIVMRSFGTSRFLPEFVCRMLRLPARSCLPTGSIRNKAKRSRRERSPGARRRPVKPRVKFRQVLSSDVKPRQALQRGRALTNSMACGASRAASAWRVVGAGRRRRRDPTGAPRHALGHRVELGEQPLARRPRHRPLAAPSTALYRSSRSSTRSSRSIARKLAVGDAPRGEPQRRLEPGDLHPRMVELRLALARRQRLGDDLAHPLARHPFLAPDRRIGPARLHHRQNADAPEFAISGRGAAGGGGRGERREASVTGRLLRRARRSRRRARGYCEGVG